MDNRSPNEARRRGYPHSRRTTTRWFASRGMSGAPPSAGVTLRRLAAFVDESKSRFSRHITISANGPALQGDTVALSGTAYRETLTRHAVLLKQAETFRARPDDFALPAV